MDGHTADVVLAAILGGSTMITMIVYMGLSAWKRVVTIQSEAQVKSAAASHDEVELVLRELTELRDTTTRYDLSFDAALQRIESRVGHLEQRALDSAVQRVGDR